MYIFHLYSLSFNLLSIVYSYPISNWPCSHVPNKFSNLIFSNAEPQAKLIPFMFATCFSRVKSPPHHLYHQYGNFLYNHINNIFIRYKLFCYVMLFLFFKLFFYVEFTRTFFDLYAPTYPTYFSVCIMSVTTKKFSIIIHIIILLYITIHFISLRINISSILSSSYNTYVANFISISIRYLYCASNMCIRTDRY